MNEQTKRWVVNVGIVLALSVLTVFLCMVMAANKRQEEPAASEEPPVAVSVWTVAGTNVDDVIYLPGLIQPRQDVHVSAEQAGKIVALAFDKGAEVSAGALLLEVDSRLHAQAARAAELELQEAGRDFERWTALAKTGSVPGKELDDVTLRRNQAQIALERVRTVLSQCRVTSPIDGIVQERFVESGEYVAPGVPVCRLVDVRQVKLMLEVPERDVLSLKLNQRVPFIIDALPNRQFEANIHFIAPAGASGSNTFRVELLVDNEKRELRAGLIARVALTRGRHEDAIIVPLDVLVPRKGQYVAFVKEGDYAVRRVVRVATYVNSSAVVASGLERGDALIVEGQRGLADGMPVVVAAEANATDGDVTE